MKDNLFYIYAIVNSINLKIYVGLTTKTLKERLVGHFYSALKDREKPDTYLYRAIRKYGKENFTIHKLDEANTLSELQRKEIWWIEKFNARDSKIGYNCTPGGDGLIGRLPADVLAKSLKTRAKNVKNFGLTYSKKYNWGFEIQWRDIRVRRGKYKARKDAQIARDLFILKNISFEEAKLLLFYPENLDLYLSEQIKEPTRSMCRSPKKSNYRYLVYNKRNKTWRISIVINGKTIRKGMYQNDREAAEMADFIIVQSKNKKRLNFPEKIDLYLSPEYQPVKTIGVSSRKLPYKYLTFHITKKKYMVHFQAKKFRAQKAFKTLEEAVNFRNLTLASLMLPIPD